MTKQTTIVVIGSLRVKLTFFIFSRKQGFTFYLKQNDLNKISNPVLLGTYVSTVYFKHLLRLNVAY